MLKASQGKVSEAKLRAVVTRADGTVEDYGVVSYYSPNPMKRALWWIRSRGHRFFMKKKGQ